MPSSLNSRKQDNLSKPNSWQSASILRVPVQAGLAFQPSWVWVVSSWCDWRSGKIATSKNFFFHSCLKFYPYWFLPSVWKEKTQEEDAGCLLSNFAWGWPLTRVMWGRQSVQTGISYNFPVHADKIQYCTRPQSFGAGAENQRAFQWLFLRKQNSSNELGLTKVRSWHLTYAWLNSFICIQYAMSLMLI